jgi:zinc transport system ATP-binding protein
MPLISCRDISLGYEGKTIISALSFEVNAGDYLCIVGENGTGKSTLMKTILKLKSPMAGHIAVGDGLLPNEIGYLPQQTEVQKDFPASVAEIVRSGCLNRSGIRPFYTWEEKQTANDNMDKLGILDLSKRCYRDLSGGQQQRVLLARALCATQKLILLDEPTAGLDPLATEELYRLIQNINREGVTVVMVSHDIITVVHAASHILHIGAYNEFFFGTAAEYLKNSKNLSYMNKYGTPA